MDTRKIESPTFVKTQPMPSKKITNEPAKRKISKKHDNDKLEEKIAKKSIFNATYIMNSRLDDKKVINKKRTSVRETEAFLLDKMKSLGSDPISNDTFEKLMRSSFKKSAPYIIVQIYDNNDDVFYLDGQSLASALLRFPPVASDICLNLFNVPIKSMQYIGMVPWNKEGFPCGFINADSAKEDIQRHDFLYLSSSSKASWVRGISYSRFSLGLNVQKDEKIAEFLYSNSLLTERKASLDAALVHAAHAMESKIIKFLLVKGADAAPCVQSDEFLPLTIAAKAGRIDTVKLLLEAGADPRQQASGSHGTALSWSQNNLEMRALLLNWLNGKDSTIIMRPDLNGKWVEHYLSSNSGNRIK